MRIGLDLMLDKGSKISLITIPILNSRAAELTAIPMIFNRRKNDTQPSLLFHPNILVENKNGQIGTEKPPRHCF